MEYKELVLSVYSDAKIVNITGQHRHDLRDVTQENSNFVGIKTARKYLAYGYACGSENELWHRVWIRIQQELERKLSK